jgi:hypothetical protein
MATRFRLTTVDTDPAVLPAHSTVPAVYTHIRTGTPEYRQLLTVDSSTLTTLNYVPDSTDHLVAGDSLFTTYVSAPIAAGVVFTSGETIKFAVQAIEAHANNNLSVQIWVGIYDSVGTTLQRAIRSRVTDSPELVVTPATNRFLSTTQDGATYTTAANDVLVVEWSLQGTPTATTGTQGHNGTFTFGSAGAGGDLPENDTEAGTTFNPWIEFVPNIFPAAAASLIYDAGMNAALVVQ